MTNKRIWELDALRGICILGMILIHFLYDLIDLMGVGGSYPRVMLWMKDWGGIAFILISGICATLGSRSVRRGLIVFGCGLLCTAVTAGMAALGMAGSGIIIRFGILHCLGICMILWQPAKHLSVWALAALGAAVITLGFWFGTFWVETPFLYPLGLRNAAFSSSDYFPLLPYFGFFLMGAVLGRILYREKASLLPHVNIQNPAVRFLTACGRNSLVIYLLHQPVLMGIFALLAILCKS